MYVLFINVLVSLVTDDFDLPIMRRAGLPASLGGAAGEASFAESLSAMVEALLQANLSWSQNHGQLLAKKMAREV